MNAAWCWLSWFAGLRCVVDLDDAFVIVFDAFDSCFSLFGREIIGYLTFEINELRFAAIILLQLLDGEVCHLRVGIVSVLIRSTIANL